MCKKLWSTYVDISICCNKTRLRACIIYIALRNSHFITYKSKNAKKFRFYGQPSCLCMVYVDGRYFRVDTLNLYSVHCLYRHISSARCTHDLRNRLLIVESSQNPTFRQLQLLSIDGPCVCVGHILNMSTLKLLGRMHPRHCLLLQTCPIPTHAPQKTNHDAQISKLPCRTQVWRCYCSLLIKSVCFSESAYY